MRMKFLLGFVLGLWLLIYLKSFIERYKGGLDAHEAKIRQRVRTVMSRTIEVTAVILLVLHFFAHPLSTPIAAAIVGISAWFTSTAANFYFRRVQKAH